MDGFIFFEAKGNEPSMSHKCREVEKTDEWEREPVASEMGGKVGGVGGK
jgi:hypothetical protein